MTHAELEARLAELLVRDGLVSATTLDRAGALRRQRSCTLARALLDLRLIGAEQLRVLLEEITGARFVDPSLMTVYPDFIGRMNLLIPPDAIGRFLLFPAQAELNTIHVCMLNPTDGRLVRALEALSGCRVAALVSHELAVRAAIEKHYGAGCLQPGFEQDLGALEPIYRARLAEPLETYLGPAVSLVNRSRDGIARDPRVLEAIVREPAVILLVHQILARAIEAGASDIHVEPTGAGLRIRLRLDGAMQTRHVLPAAMSAPVVARLKAMADLPLASDPRPLDGRIGYDIVLGRGIDLRFSLVPSISGETVVLRVLDRGSSRRTLADLGADGRVQRLLHAATDLPNGLILVTGPTGSGKSSTLYALLDRLNGEDACILTAEDPVESAIEGVVQVHCEESRGLSFADALRSFLRQDPDVLMVGEIRDAETADIALKAALTGHLVLSTLHTNDASGAVLRLLNMDLEPFLIASALRLVVAQRLVRRLCPRCRVPDPAAGERVARLWTADSRLLPATPTVFGPAGCAECLGTGFRGRTGIFEVLRVSGSVEELILRRASASAIRERARAEGMLTLREAGLLRVAEGETALAEVLEHTTGMNDEDTSGAGEQVVYA